MACHLFGAKPLSEPMLPYGPLGTKFSEIWTQNSVIFIQENAFENVVCQNGGHFDQGEMSQ